ncbi:MAG: HEPN domain-containing protein [Proteobacteria bacterium]|nr:HEPN domain-containing protein [Pseudomonadota bacterium]
MTEETKRYIERAEHALEVAKELKKGGYIPDAASKVYYAMFYAAQALLKNEGIDVIKHSQLNQHLVIVLPNQVESTRSITKC